MVTVYRTIRRALLQGAILLGTACAASAATQPPEVLDQLAEAPAEPANITPSIAWLEQPIQMQREDGGDALGNVAAPAALLASHLKHIAREREDMDLSAYESAAQRYNLVDDEPIVSEHWWQALPGIAVALFLGLMLYMRHPIQRKRKYRSTPHQPSGGYSRRAP
jgi:hypothetical protein